MNKKTISLNLEESVINCIEYISEFTGISKSGVANMCLKAYLNHSIFEDHQELKELLDRCNGINRAIEIYKQHYVAP